MVETFSFAIEKISESVLKHGASTLALLNCAVKSGQDDKFYVVFHFFFFFFFATVNFKKENHSERQYSLDFFCSSVYPEQKALQVFLQVSLRETGSEMQQFICITTRLGAFHFPFPDVAHLEGAVYQVPSAGSQSPFVICA